MTIYLEDRRLQAADLLTKLQHVFGGFPLLFIGLKHLFSATPEWPMAIVELAIGAIVIGAFLRELRQTMKAREHGHASKWHSAIGWFDLAAGGLLIFEAFHQPHVKPGFLRPPFLSGIVTIGLGLFHSRFHAFRDRRRYLELDANGLACRLSPFRRFRFAWTQLKSVEISEKQVIFQPREGQSRAIRFTLYNNGDAIRSAILDHARAAGLLASSSGQEAGQLDTRAPQPVTKSLP